VPDSHGPLDEFREAVLDLKALMNAAGDQARAMTDAELGQLLLTGPWTTIEIHEAGHRLVSRGSESVDE
jgi:hypothetical protein